MWNATSTGQKAAPRHLAPTRQAAARGRLQSEELTDDLDRLDDASGGSQLKEQLVDVIERVVATRVGRRQGEPFAGALARLGATPGGRRTLARIGAVLKRRLEPLSGSHLDGQFVGLLKRLVAAPGGSQQEANILGELWNLGALRSGRGPGEPLGDALNRLWPSAEAAERDFERVRWPDGPVCPYCGSQTIALHRESETTRSSRFQCWTCHKSFSPTVGTFFRKSRIALRTWFYLLAYAVDPPRELERWLVTCVGIPRATVRVMLRRLRRATADDLKLLEALVGWVMPTSQAARTRLGSIAAGPSRPARKARKLVSPEIRKARRAKKAEMEARKARQSKRRADPILAPQSVNRPRSLTPFGAQP